MKRRFLGTMSLVVALPLSGVLAAVASTASHTEQASATLMQQGKTITVKGKVVDKTGEAIIGANIRVDGTSTGAVTDIDGNFTVNAPASGTLTVSYVGMKAQKIAISGRTQLAISLEDEATGLETVVVTALGIKRSQKALSYNVQEIKNDALTTVKDANFMNALSGKVAGININASASGMGGATRVVMRGPKSMNQSNQALYVIDGVPIFNVNGVSKTRVVLKSGQALINLYRKILR